ncbi:MAG: class I SAM-dependent methyltransferase [Microgenomates group bacterium]
MNTMQNYNYQDSSEEFLLKFFDKPQSQKEEEISQILAENPPWPILYHLHPQRNFILSWYPLKKNASLLEIGAGCGAITGMLCERVRKVVAVELTKERADIIKKRFVDKKNLKVFAGNFNELSLKEKFDYITLIGVLEYQGRYTKSSSNDIDEPYVNFLKEVKNYLKKNGKLLIAIENKIGLKYLAGGREDHYGSLFESIENYPNYSGIKTFTKNEIEEILKKAGFERFKFYYPYPDYKLPYFILTEDGYNLNLANSLMSQIKDLSQERLFLFNESLFFKSLKKEKILDKFSNSFLIECQI